MAEVLPLAAAYAAAELPAPLALPQMPSIFRLTSLRCTAADNGVYQCTATLFHERAAIRVYWPSSRPEIRIHAGDLVSPRWQIRVASEAGAIHIHHLVLLERPEPTANPFQTVPTGWVPDRELVKRAADLVDELPRPYRHLFNAIFWNSERFRRFCTGPSSVHGHHNGACGNLAHCVDVAELMRGLCRTRARAHSDLGILLGLLHDAGKADEYRLGPGGQWAMSDRGRLLGHRETVGEWVSAALARHPGLVSERQQLALLHCLKASSNAPEWLGIRRPAMVEALLLSLADRLSGESELMERCAPQREGWGRFHEHLRGRPFGL